MKNIKFMVRKKCCRQWRRRKRINIVKSVLILSTSFNVTEKRQHTSQKVENRVKKPNKATTTRGIMNENIVRTFKLLFLHFSFFFPFLNCFQSYDMCLGAPSALGINLNSNEIEENRKKRRENEVKIAI